MFDIAVCNRTGKKTESFIYQNRFFETPKKLTKYLREVRGLSEVGALKCVFSLKKKYGTPEEEFDKMLREITG